MKIKRMILEWENELGETTTLVTHAPIEGELRLDPIISDPDTSEGWPLRNISAPYLVGYNVSVTGVLKRDDTEITPSAEKAPDVRQGALLTVGEKTALIEWLDGLELSIENDEEAG